MSLNKYLEGLNIEGHSQQVPQQIHLLKQFCKIKRIKNIMEIGFNAGHSSEIFLEYNKDTNVVSFDIGSHDYVNKGKKFIDNKYPSRHTLIIGNSTKTVPAYIQQNKTKTFDLIYVDGGHTYDVARADLMNCRHLSHKDTIVVMDDIVKKRRFDMNFIRPPHVLEPTRSWEECIQNNIIKQFGQINFSNTRGVAWGKYIKNVHSAI